MRIQLISNLWHFREYDKKSKLRQLSKMGVFLESVRVCYEEKVHVLGFGGSKFVEAMLLVLVAQADQKR